MRLGVESGQLFSDMPCSAVWLGDVVRVGPSRCLLSARPQPCRHAVFFDLKARFVAETYHPAAP